MEIISKQIFNNIQQTQQAQGQQTFKLAFSLYQKLANSQNLVFSPASIYLALAMVAIGSKEQTLQEFKNLLDFNDINQLSKATASILKILQKDENNLKAHIANKVYSGLPELGADYQLIVSQNLGATIEKVNFIQYFEQIRTQINEWVQLVTQQKIKNLLPPGSLNQSTAMVLVNAIYFKGDWFKKFDKKKTQKLDFFLEYENAGQKIKTDIMSIQEYFDYYEDGNFQYIQIPYKGGQYSMEILLPRSSIQQFEQTLSDQVFQKARVNKFNKKLKLYLPKFKIQPESVIDLQYILKQLGITTAFSNNADFSFMDPTKKVVLSNVYHKSVIEVNEDGAEAAASTAVVMQLSIQKDIQMLCNKPFIYSITHIPSQTILFLGKVTDPSKLS
ncbi:proteinase inhibitor I4 serpin (macronuclear) [Tetrahymena thermophila SB210]|uniref:Proteinase inhibitor I4 serpin n=1 Tax=Tetrahymena thermophila (strain SB210) TaxID=312017 RepID=I7M668_TETTS|nr:proteinase inhibitor I4 serpin [Tetrahymena thermophila SB210]EAR84457.2 proteinase inhibitor I4 serpin [Tetrahymena thermophila SB210]|eukprot:XP_001032120.2 proteinase inhibitor I4 serpin [Tetrahymena thermophila SB210]